VLLALASVLVSDSASAQKQPQSLIGRPAPALATVDLEGHRLSLKRLRGRVVLLNFWATWCAPCQAEMPTFEQWQQQMAGQGLSVVGVSMDDEADGVRRLTRRLLIHYPVAMGSARLGTSYGGVLGLPITYLIDRHGIIRSRFEGEQNPNTILAALKPLLAER